MECLLSKYCLLEFKKWMMTNVEYLLSKYCLLEFKKIQSKKKKKKKKEKEKQVSSPSLRKPVDREFSPSITWLM